MFGVLVLLRFTLHYNSGPPWRTRFLLVFLVLHTVIM